MRQKIIENAIAHFTKESSRRKCEHIKLDSTVTIRVEKIGPNRFAYVHRTKRMAIPWAFRQFARPAEDDRVNTGNAAIFLLQNIATYQDNRLERTTPLKLTSLRLSVAQSFSKLQFAHWPLLTTARRATKLSLGLAESREFGR
jgi:hypothetical protein